MVAMCQKGLTMLWRSFQVFLDYVVIHLGIVLEKAEEIE